MAFMFLMNKFNALLTWTYQPTELVKLVLKTFIVINYR